MIAEWGEIPEEEMYNVFNMGIGFIIIIDKNALRDMETFLRERGEKFFVIGEVIKGKGEVILI